MLCKRPVRLLALGPHGSLCPHQAPRGPRCHGPHGPVPGVRRSPGTLAPVSAQRAVRWSSCQHNDIDTVIVIVIARPARPGLSRRRHGGVLRGEEGLCACGGAHDMCARAHTTRRWHAHASFAPRRALTPYARSHRPALPSVCSCSCSCRRGWKWTKPSNSASTCYVSVTSTHAYTCTRLRGRGEGGVWGRGHDRSAR